MKKSIAKILAFLPFMGAFMGETKESQKVMPIVNTDNDLEWTNRAMMRNHNNRKNTKGRFTQYVPLGNGIFRAIYHGANR